MKKDSELVAMQHLAQNFKLNIWENSLAIPYQKSKNNRNLLLEKKLFFTWVEEKQKILIFVSIQSSLAEIFQFASFFEKPIVIYLTFIQLIRERLAVLQGAKQHSQNNFISSFLQELLELATYKKATDIHLEPTKKDIYNLQLRINGILQAYKDSAPAEVLFKIKLLSKMDIAKTHFPQDGYMNFTNKLGKKFDLRVSTLPSVMGEKMVVRILPLENLEINLEKLNFTAAFIAAIKKVIQAQSGWIVVAGPTGSGKTTTLYSIVRELIKKNLNIITVEDPVEYRLAGVTQVEVKEKIGLTFAKILRSSLRQDPDVILIGEIRDEETAKIAASAAKTGHLVLTTVHSANVLETIQRLKFLQISSEDLANSFKLIIAQRLLIAPKLHQRIPVIEYLENSTKIRNAILEEKSIIEIEKIMKLQKFVSLQENANKLGISIME